MYKTTKTYKVSNDTTIDKIFPDGLPVNAFIDKGRCAIGATRLEIRDLSRPTIITVPNISILLSKKEQHPEIDIVYGDVSYKMVLNLLTSVKRGHKIMTTPEGMGKIMKAAAECGRLEEVYSDWFLLLDEGHTFISEAYREDILVPFLYFWRFSKKSIISATPYYFSDERYRQLDYHKIEFTETIGKVRLINATSPFGALNHILTHLQDVQGNLHIFLNSVTQIAHAIRRAELKDCAVFCARDKDGVNMRTLGEFSQFYIEQPKEGMYRKVNFYTCKYFEGWDLYDENATIILVTDYHKEHTKIGISTKGKQAIGRLRNTPNEVLHITNHGFTKTMKTLEAFGDDYREEADFLIAQNNAYVSHCQQRSTVVKPDERLDKFADVDKDTKLATLNIMKLDQQINEAANNEIYNHIDYIEQDWRDAYFDVEREDSDLKIENSTTIKRKSASKQLEEDYQCLLKLRPAQRANQVIDLFKNVEQDIKKSNPVAYEACKELDEGTMVDLKYNVKQVKKAIILKANSRANVKLAKLVNETFKVGSFYTNQVIKSKLQEFYSLLNVRDEVGKTIVATANQLETSGRFEVKEAKKRGADGKEENGKVILRQQFALRMAA